MFERYYTTEQLEQLKQRGEQVGPERIAAVQQEWATLFAGLAAAQADGEGAESERVLALGRQAEALIEEFTGGDAGIRESLANLYRGEGGGEAVLGQHGMDVGGGSWGLLQQAMAAAREQGNADGQP